MPSSSLSVSRTTSASQLGCYAMCPRKYACQYVYDFEPEFRSLALITGSALHSAVGWWFTERLSGKQPTLESAEQLLAADLHAGEAGVRVRWKNATAESVELEAQRLLRTYLERFGDLPVAAVEQGFQVDLSDPTTGEILGRPMKGFFDLVLEDGRIIELKTSSRGWSPNELDRHLQVGAYCYARNTLEGGPSKLEVHVIVKLKREPRVETHLVERGEPADRWWLAAAAEIEASIAARRFPPSPSALCHECEHSSACLAWSLETERPAYARGRLRTDHQSPQSMPFLI